MQRREFIMLLGGVAAWPIAAQAQAGYPDHPITLIVPYAAGGGNDVLARAVAEPMGKVLGQPLVIENHGGAGGSVGTRQVAKAAPDGYTLGLGGTGTLAIDPTLYPNVGYDPRKDFAPIGLIATSPLIILVNQSVAAHNVQELIALAKAQPGKLNYASAGTGSGIHLGTVLFADTAGIDITHIPYKGSGPALTDLLGGHVQIYFSSLPPAVGLVKERQTARARCHRPEALRHRFPMCRRWPSKGCPASRPCCTTGSSRRPVRRGRSSTSSMRRCARRWVIRKFTTTSRPRAPSRCQRARTNMRRHRPRGNEVVGLGEEVRRVSEIRR